MEKRRYSQLELFSTSKGISRVDPKSSNSFLSHIWGYERMILIIMGFIITGIISFSLGIERGKRLAMLLPDSAGGTKQPVIQKQKITVESPKVREEQPKAKEPVSAYTIQVATYQTKTTAQKEIEILKQKGHLPLILSEKGFTVLCVGNFPNKETAKPLLSELKKRYGDCFIRRL